MLVGSRNQISVMELDLWKIKKRRSSSRVSRLGWVPKKAQSERKHVCSIL